MKKFKFKFEAVERVRKSRETEALKKLGLAQLKLQKEKQIKYELLRALEDSLLRRELLGRESTSSTVFDLENKFITGTKQRIIQADQAILRANRELEKSMFHYLSSKRQTRAMELLRENNFEEYRKKHNKLEQKALDDLYTNRFRLSHQNDSGESK